MIPPRPALPDGTFHETGEGGEDIDGRIYLTVVQLTIDIVLTLGDVSGQVGNGMRDVVIGHGEDGGLVMEPRGPCTRPARS